MKHRDKSGIDRIISFMNDWYRDNHTAPSGRRIATGTGIPLTTVQRMLKTMQADGLIDFDGQTVVTELTGKTSIETTSVGIIGNIPCGNLALEEEAVEEIVQLPVSLVGKGELFMLHARGDSMTGAGIDDGDLVLIRKQEEAYPGDIVVAYVEGEGNTLKRYKKYGNTVFLHPENPKYKDIAVQDCRIQGVAFKVLKTLS